jgi:hypothetical protein
VTWLNLRSGASTRDPERAAGCASDAAGGERRDDDQRRSGDREQAGGDDGKIAGVDLLG